MNKRPRAEDNAWGEPKTGRQFTITESASQMIDRMALETDNSRSEFLERLIRWIDALWDSQLRRDFEGDFEGDLEGDRDPS